jgi:hypothetical protein
MPLEIRKLQHEDYDNILVEWWEIWGWEAPVREFLPDNGTGGFIVYDRDIPVCAGFIYTTNSKAAWVDWIISNPKYREKPYRKTAINMLIDFLCKMAVNDGYKFIYALLKHSSLIQTYKDLGFIQAETYNTEMIKII